MRPLALLLATSVALLAQGWTGTATASSATAVVVKPAQDLVALLRSHRAHARPTAASALLAVVPAQTPITGERMTLPVLAQQGRWLEVMLPGRPDGHTGWIDRAATTLLLTNWHIVVDRARRRVTVYRAGLPVRTFEAIVGKPSTPTPTGEFFVEESVALRASDVGAPFALALSARSNVLQEFDGGPGQIALHGLSNIGGVLGTAISHGCVRLANAAMRWLVARIAPGTPVTIAG